MFNVEQIEILKKFILEMAKNVAINSGDQFLYKLTLYCEEKENLRKFQQMTCNSNFRLF